MPSSDRPPSRLVLFFLATLVSPTPADPADYSNREPALERAQHLRRLGVAAWHEQGYRGKGITVAILDSGFSGYRTQLGKALPQNVKIRSFRRDGNLEAKDSQHGILCGEVVHFLAPEAELLFANWEPNHPDQFLDAVQWAIEQGAQVISCSIIMPTWSDGEGKGPIHAEMARLLGDGRRRTDTLFIACAGNTADRHWSGAYSDDGHGNHLWADRYTDNSLMPWGKGQVSIELCTEEELDLEVGVQDTTTQKDIERSRIRSHGEHRCAVVHFQPEIGHSYRVRLRAVGSRTGKFHLFVLGASLHCARSNGSIPFPGDGPEVLTVGAVDEQGSRMSYSSCGPNSRQLKPDLVAPVPFESYCRARPFSGTSAAAPQAAALAALLLERHRDWTPNQVREALQRSAFDLGPRGHDWETGYGLIRLPAAK